MTATDQQQLGKTLWAIADDLRGAMNADDFRDYMLSFLFLRYLSDNYETAAKKELGKEYQPAGAQIFSLKFNKKDFGKQNLSLKSRRVKNQSVEEEVNNAQEIIDICLEMIGKFTTDISQGKFHLSTLKNRDAKVCKFCDFKRICRIQEVN